MREFMLMQGKNAGNPDGLSSILSSRSINSSLKIEVQITSVTLTYHFENIHSSDRNPLYSVYGQIFVQIKKRLEKDNYS